MTWRDLRARLEAARDLRRSLGNGEDESLASFDADSARRIAALADGKGTVNPCDLGNGKQGGRINAASQDAGTDSAPRN